MTRREAREQAFHLVFQLQYTDDPVDQLLEDAVQCRDEVIDDYAAQVARAAQEHLLEIDAVISRHSAKWKLSRLPKVTVAILRLAVCELDYMKDIPVGTAINEAVELAKKYGGEEDSAYVNGVLGGYVRSRPTQDPVEEA